MDLHEEIARVAYELFEKSGSRRGREFENWIDAERIVLMRHASQDIEEPEGEEPMIGEALNEEVEEKGTPSGGWKIETKAVVIEEIDVREPALASKKDMSVKSERNRPPESASASGKKTLPDEILRKRRDNVPQKKGASHRSNK